MIRTSARSSWKRRRLTLLAIAATVVAACNSGSVDAVPGPEDVRVTCGEAYLGTPGAMTDFADLPDDAAAALAEASQRSGAVHERVFRSYDWASTSVGDDQMLFYGHTVRHGEDMHATLSLERQAGLWTARAWDMCLPQVAAPEGFEIAALGVDPAFAPTPEDKELDLQMDAIRCDSSDPPNDEEWTPVIVPSDDRVVITALVEEDGGFLGCPGGPSLRMITVSLGEPLGERSLFDGRNVPLEKPLWPPEEQ